MRRTSLFGSELLLPPCSPEYVGKSSSGLRHYSPPISLGVLGSYSKIDSHLRAFSPEVQPLYKRGKTASLCVYLTVRRSPSVRPSVRPSFHPPFILDSSADPSILLPAIHRSFRPQPRSLLPLSLLLSLCHAPLIQAPVLPAIQPFVQEVLTAPHHVPGTVLGAGTWARAKYTEFLT